VLRFVGMDSEIVSERQAQSRFSGRLCEVNMVGPALSIRWHTLDEEHPIRLRVFCPEGVPQPLKRLDGYAPRLSK
jgi:hypothetical protein